MKHFGQQPLIKKGRTNIYKRQKRTLEINRYLFKKGIMLHYIDTSQVLKFTGLSRSTLDRAKAKKEIKYFKKGRRCLYKLEDVRNWIEGDAPKCH